MYDSKARYVRNLFSKVPLEYDLLLGLLSFGQDKKWRAFVVQQAKPQSDSLVLDVATGTGLLASDFAKAITNTGLVVGVDLTLSMLRTAKERLLRKGFTGRTDWVLARAENLPFRENRFRSATISLALRNVSDAQLTLGEMARVALPGGVVISLDFARPPNKIFRLFYYDYLLGLFPIFGRMVSKAWGKTLSYLGRSILKSRTGPQIAAIMTRVGLSDIEPVPLTQGIVYAVYGKKL